MSAYGGPQTADDEREDLLYCGVTEGWGDGDVEEPDAGDLEPLPLPPERVRVVGEVCGRPVARRHHGSNFGPCFGRVTDGGGCTQGCVPR